MTGRASVSCLTDLSRFCSRRGALRRSRGKQPLGCEGGSCLVRLDVKVVPVCRKSTERFAFKHPLDPMRRWFLSSLLVIHSFQLQCCPPVSLLLIEACVHVVNSCLIEPSSECWLVVNQGSPLPSNRHHPSSGDCLEGKGENYQVCSVQYCVQQLCTVRCTHI